MPTPEYSSYSEIAADLRNLVDRLRTIGIDLDRGRVRRYLQILESRNGTADERITAATEATCLAEIAALPLEALEPVRHRLGELCAGPFAPDPNHADQGRDLAFELQVAAKLLEASDQVSLSNPADVTLTRGDRQMLVECKRPTSRPALGRAIVKAYRQLSEHRRSGVRGFGAIAIDSSMIVNPLNGILQAPQGSPPIRGDECTTRLNFALEMLLREEQHSLRRSAANTRSDSLNHIFLFRTFALVDIGGRAPIRTTAWRVTPAVSDGSHEFLQIHDWLSQIRGSDPTLYRFSNIPRR